jgi:hypothetical protein
MVDTAIHISSRDCVNHWTLIVGEVNTGKTLLTRRLLEGLCSELGPEEVAVVDLAPKIPSEVLQARELTGIGGTLPPPHPCVLYLHVSLRPPRLISASEQEAIGVARENLQKIQVLFEAYRFSGRKALVINDISMALQAGTPEDLIRWMGEASTVVANGYLGERLGSGELSRIERHNMERLMEGFHRVINLPIGGDQGVMP